MIQRKSQALFRKAMIAGWAMFTLVLFFCVILLSYQLFRRDQGVISGEGSLRLSQLSRHNISGSSSDREIRLYFASPDSRGLVAENRTIECTDVTTENCRRALQALIEGPRDVLQPVLPPATRIRAVYLLDGGELVVDLSREVVLQKQKSASSEALMLYGVVNTLTQEALSGQGSAPATCVRLLIEGACPSESFPHHIDASAPIAPDPSWIVPEEPTHGS